MAFEKVPIYRFGKGLQTKGTEDFSGPDEFRVAQNVRFRTGNARRRAGQSNIALAGSDNTARNFDGVNDVITVPKDARVWALPLRFTLRFLISGDDTPAGDEYFLGWSGTGNKPLTIKRDANRKIVVDFWDSAGTQTTLTSATATTNATAYPCALIRDRSTLTLWIENTADVTSTSVSATLLGRTPADNLTFGAHNGANFFDGTIDYVDLQNVVYTSNADGWLRLVDPRAEHVLADYGFEVDANGLLTDRSRYENTGLNSGSSSATALCIQHSPVLGMAPRVDAAGRKKVLTIAGGLVYDVEMV